MYKSNHYLKVRLGRQSPCTCRECSIDRKHPGIRRVRSAKKAERRLAVKEVQRDLSD